LEMTVYHLLMLSHQTILFTANLKRQRAKESETKNSFRKLLHVLLRVTCEHKPHAGENRTES